MSENPHISSDAIEARNAMMSAMEVVGSIMEAAAGYRAKAVEHGFSEMAAEQMAVDLHSQMLRACLQHATPKSP